MPDRHSRPVSPSAMVRATTESQSSPDRKSTRLNSSYTVISYAVFCLKKKKKIQYNLPNHRQQKNKHRHKKEQKNPNTCNNKNTKYTTNYRQRTLKSATRHVAYCPTST